MSDLQTAIQPIDHMVLAGFQQRFQQVFGCAKCLFINANDKTKIIERIFGQGQPLEYPYAYFVIQSIGANNESYNSHAMSRRGIPVNLTSGSTIQTVRVIPTNFIVEVTYVTNKFESVEQGSVLAFVRRWLLARRIGYLKFSINYGRLQFGINQTMDESVNIPQRENIAENESSYTTVASATIHGYISEPVLGQKGRVTQVRVNSQVGGVTGTGTIISTQYLEFPKQS
jgi:hypothetical protein